ncbi:MAG TPA: TIGR03619 family F420-dependent LLM class oxidoreductase [Streptosporangiaceae bacterium]
MLIGANLVANEATPSIVDIAVRAEDRGMDCIFQGEHSHVPVATEYPGAANGVEMPEFYRRFPDVFVLLAAAAAVTTRLRLGTGVALVAEHNSFHLAKATATLDVISGGRLDLGVGYGWNRPEMINNGVPWESRREVFAEKLAVLKRLWTEDAVAHDGTFGSFTESWVWPKPVQAPHPPILIGGAGFRWQLEDVVRLADGWYPMDGPELPGRLQRLRKMAADAGRPAPSVSVNYMAGQMPGNPWYWEDAQAMDTLLEKAAAYQELGVQRIIVGVPMDSLDNLTRGLDALATIIDRFA